MKLVNIYKAQPTTKEIESATIVIDKVFPEAEQGRNWLVRHSALLEKEGMQLAEILCDTLPQGVVDVLLIELLKRRRSMASIGITPAEGI